MTSSVKRYGNILFFVGGFIFDVITLNRIDNVLDLLWQSVYLTGITAILLMDARVHWGHWTPAPKIAKLWHHSTEALHFSYGGLLSGYVIFYFKSASASRSLVFLSLVALLMFLNEMPQVKAAGNRMRLGLYAFCVVSYLNYLIPVIAGRMGTWSFILAVLLTAAICYEVTRRLVSWHPEADGAAWSLGWPPALVLIVITTLYACKWIPPVPLSLKFIGIYHQIEKADGHYRLIYPKQPIYRSGATRVVPSRCARAMSCTAWLVSSGRAVSRIKCFCAGKKNSRTDAG